MELKLRKVIVGEIAHIQHALRIGDLPLNEADELLAHVNAALEGRLTEDDAQLCNVALEVVNASHKAHRRILDKGARELGQIMEKALTITDANHGALHHGAGRPRKWVSGHGKGGAPGDPRKKKENPA